jgi:hypothetical protein
MAEEVQLYWQYVQVALLLRSSSLFNCLTERTRMLPVEGLFYPNGKRRIRRIGISIPVQAADCSNTQCNPTDVHRLKTISSRARLAMENVTPVLLMSSCPAVNAELASTREISSRF